MDNLLPDHLADLKKSSLSDEFIEKAGIYSVPPGDIPKIMGWDAPINSMLAFPYPETDCTRYKLFPPLKRKGEPRAQKYFQAKGSGLHLYQLPGFDSDANDIYITEGEKKTLKACQDGLNCLGLSGLWNWKVKSEDALIADFDLFNFKGKNVYLVPDNDWQAPDKNLVQAVYRLAYLLRARGALLSILQLPEDSGKVGLDDYLVSHTLEEFHALPIIQVKSLKERVAEATPENYQNVLPEIKKVGDAIERAIFCRSLAKQIKVPVSVIQQSIVPSQLEVSKDSIVEDVEAWETPVDGERLLDDVYDVIKRHIVLDSPAIAASALWIVLTYSYDHFRILPLLGITSPEKRCGKTTFLEILDGLTNKPLLASSITPSAIFRTIEKCRPCLLIDEADTFLKDNEQLRGIINSGHTHRSAFVIRTNTVTFDPERFSTWGPKAIALIGGLPGTITDRSIPIRLKRKTTAEKVSKVSIDFDDEQMNLRRKMKRWAIDNAETLKTITPEIPKTGNDRAADNWTSLLSIAETAGGVWSARARQSMLALEKVSDDDSIRQILLRDIKEIIGERERISSNDLVSELVAIEDHPWGDWRKGKAITQNGLARLLKPFNILSKTIRIGGNTPKGYTLEQFVDVFERYLPSTPPVQSATTPQLTSTKDLRVFQSATQSKNVAVENQWKPTPVTECGVVAVERGGEQERMVLNDIRI